MYIYHFINYNNRAKWLLIIPIPLPCKTCKRSLVYIPMLWCQWALFIVSVRVTRRFEGIPFFVTVVSGIPPRPAKTCFPFRNTSVRIWPELSNARSRKKVLYVPSQGLYLSLALSSSTLILTNWFFSEQASSHRVSETLTESELHRNWTVQWSCHHISIRTRENRWSHEGNIYIILVYFIQPKRILNFYPSLPEARLFTFRYDLWF